MILLFFVGLVIAFHCEIFVMSLAAAFPCSIRVTQCDNDNVEFFCKKVKQRPGLVGASIFRQFEKTAIWNTHMSNIVN